MESHGPLVSSVYLAAATKSLTELKDDGNSGHCCVDLYRHWRRNLYDAAPAAGAARLSLAPPDRRVPPQFPRRDDLAAGALSPRGRAPLARFRPAVARRRI